MVIAGAAIESAGEEVPASALKIIFPLVVMFVVALMLRLPPPEPQVSAVPDVVVIAPFCAVNTLLPDDVSLTLLKEIAP